LLENEATKKLLSSRQYSSRPFGAMVSLIA
jgi:hypothetical protein